MDNSKEEGQDELSSLKQTIAKLTQEINELKGTILKKDAQLTVVKDKEVQIRRIAKKYKDSYFNLKALDDQREAEIASIFLDQAVAATDARNRVAADHDLVALENQLEAKMKNFFEDPYKLEIMAQLGEENETVKTAFDHLYRQFQQQQASKPSTSSGTVETSSMGRKRWIEDESSSSLGPAPKILVTDADDKNVTIEMDVKDDEPGANNEISSGQDDNQVSFGVRLLDFFISAIKISEPTKFRQDGSQTFYTFSFWGLVDSRDVKTIFQCLEQLCVSSP